MDSNSDFGNHANTEIGQQAHEVDMEIGYEDNPFHLNFEGLEKRFQEEILKLIKEQIDAENAENARHREVYFRNSGVNIIIILLRASHFLSYG